MSELIFVSSLYFALNMQFSEPRSRLGHWCLWIPRLPCGAAASRKGVSCSRVRVFISTSSSDCCDRAEHKASAARGAKADHLKSSYASYGDHFESVKITDIARDQFPEALVGVGAVIHLASPLPGRLDPAALLAVSLHLELSR